jgi:hypothetical protein
VSLDYRSGIDLAGHAGELDRIAMLMESGCELHQDKLDGFLRQAAAEVERTAACHLLLENGVKFGMAPLFRKGHVQGGS